MLDSNLERTSLGNHNRMHHSGEKGYWHRSHNRTNPQKGKHPSEETRKKLSEASKGENNYWYGKFGKDHPGFGRKQTPEEIKRRTDKIRGKNHPQYKIAQQNPLRYIQKSGLGWRITKRVNGPKKSFGTYPTKDEAIKIRNLLEENNWNKKILKESDLNRD